MTILGVTISMSVFWLVAAIIFAAIEGLTMGLTTIWFAAGAVVAMIAALLGAGIAVQVVLFFAASILLLVFTRKLFVKKLHTGAEKTNVDALIGKEAVVKTAIRPFSPGVVRIGGQDWTAVCQDADEALEEGTEVKVIGIEGVKAIVSPLNKQEV